MSRVYNGFDIAAALIMQSACEHTYMRQCVCVCCLPTFRVLFAFMPHALKCPSKKNSFMLARNVPNVAIKMNSLSWISARVLARCVQDSRGIHMTQGFSPINYDNGFFLQVHSFTGAVF